MDRSTRANILQEFLNSERNASFKKRIDSYANSVTLACSDVEAIKEAKELVPIAQIVQDNLSILEGNYQENLLPHIVDWFSREFFTWFQQPDCERCHIQLKLAKSFINIEGNNVENYKCNNGTCDYKYDFIRHNDPAILLRTRVGRCGEWANCFLLFLRAFDYEARMVLDTTDHVWNEVWSESQQRWLHVDPCEGVIDQPLLYELGWKKKLEYCLAVSQFDALDVTRRYSAHYEETKLKRISCDEQWLENYLDELTRNLSEMVSSVEVREEVLKHRNLDKIHLAAIPLGPRSLPDGVQLDGRKTGDIGWRISRGEFSPKMENLFVIEITKKCDISETIMNSASAPMFDLRYNSLKNSYESSTSPDLVRQGWSTLTYSCENLDYKYERDWKTSYVSRYEGCTCEKSGKLRWRFDLTKLEGNWSRIEIQLDGKIYPNTKIESVLKCYGSEPSKSESPIDEIKLSLNEMNVITKEQCQTNTVIVDLVVELAGGEQGDEVAWQKPQLFRQTRGKNDEEWPLTFRVH